MDEFLFCYKPCQIALSHGFWMFKHRDMETRIVHGLPSSNRSWRTITSSYVVITGKGSHGRNLLGTLSKSVGLGGFPCHLVCIFPLIYLFLFVVSS